MFFFSKIQMGFRASDIIFRKIPKLALEPPALEPPTAVYLVNLYAGLTVKLRFPLIWGVILRQTFFCNFSALVGLARP